MVATNINGCADTSVFQTITVNPLPVPNITLGGPTTFCDGSSVGLISDTTAGNDWLLNGVSTGITLQVNLADTSGDWQLVVTNTFGCTDTSGIVTVVVNPLPVVAVSPDTGTFCAPGDTVTLTATGAVNYAWSPNYQINDTTLATVEVYPTADTIYMVIGTNANGCVDTTTVSVQVSTVAPTAGFTGDTIVCEGSPVTMNNATTGSSTGFLWVFQGGTPDSSSIQNAVVTYDTAGTYDISLIAYGCAVNDTAVMAGYITVNSLPTAAITAGGTTTFCQGDSVTLTSDTAVGYLWNTGEATQSITVDTSGSYTVDVTDTNGCSAASAATVVTVNPLPAPVITPSGPVALCLGDSVTLTSDTAAGYSWNTGATTQSITVDTAGSYMVDITDANGCNASSAATTVTVNPVPTGTVTATPESVSGANDGTVKVAASGGTPGYTYLWVDSSGTTVGTTDSVGALAPGVYDVTVTDINGCTFTGSVTVNPGAVGINESLSSANSIIKLYPNPTTGILNLDIEPDMKVTSIKVYSIIGSLVYEITNGIDLTKDHYVIDLSGEPGGAYLVRIQTANQVLVKKVNLSN